ncbi:MAG: hypothetical protein IJ192_02490 [Clostridia bacterium]|nr:hypothetical protein [Clostridia bacterium]
MAKYDVTNIHWDTDGDKTIENNLPSEILINTEYLDVENDEDMNEIEEAISNYLSNVYGFCHFGFDYQRV